jgi:hypothetical protein
MGKFMKLWKLRESDPCPRCGQLEDAQHATCLDLLRDELQGNLGPLPEQTQVLDDF